MRPISEFEWQLQNDLETLGLVRNGLEALENQWRRARLSVEARQRGYFTPDEDDWVRRMLLSYRNYRLALHELVNRYRPYAEIEPLSDRLRAFLLGLAAGLTLYSYSLRLIEAYERAPLVRDKLNEPDAKFDLPAGFFDHILRSYSSLRNYRDLIWGIWFWQAHRRAIQRLRAIPAWNQVLNLIRAERPVVRRRLTSVLFCRLRHDWRAFWQMTLHPVHKARYGVQSWVGDACAHVRTTRSHHPALTASVLHQLRPLLNPGDVLLIRAEEKLSALLPGFWAHAALYIGDRADLEPFGLAQHRLAMPHWNEVERQAVAFGAVIEAISPRVLVNSLDHSLQADHVLVLRPNLPREEIASAIGEAFGHVGKPYDFEFDFNVSTRVVCTEVIYRCYHKRGAIEFSLLKRLGRFTLTADDIVHTVLDQIAATDAASAAPFSVIALVLKADGPSSQFVPLADAVATLGRIRTGWRPSQPGSDGQPNAR
ncbi:MAG: YiiX/YebB-like N1pC/P60 family cysteine hydrolase [Verrucomicrobiota bacterium]